MSRTQYDIHTKELYTRESIENIISEQCRKNGFPAANKDLTFKSTDGQEAITDKYRRYFPKLKL